MKNIIGVRLRQVGKLKYFEIPDDLELKRGAHVVAETQKGLEYGTVIMSSVAMEEENIGEMAGTFVRTATEEDTKTELANRDAEKEAFRICKEKILERGMDMKLVESEYTLDRGKLLFYFVADGRVDFRDLVKDLAFEFHTRIELRQIGVRDETKILGGLGICGRELCCHGYLSCFAPVSIKMAKEQGISLNPTKISGVCGRLMCCLKNEEDLYEEMNKNLPKVGHAVHTPDELYGEVQNVNVLKQSVSVLVEQANGDKELRSFDVKELTFPVPKKPKTQEPVSNENSLDQKESGKKVDPGKGEKTKQLEKTDKHDTLNRKKDSKKVEGKPDRNKERKTDRNKERKPDRKKVVKKDPSRSDRRSDKKNERKNARSPEKRWDKRGEKTLDRRDKSSENDPNYKS